MQLGVRDARRTHAIDHGGTHRALNEGTERDVQRMGVGANELGAGVGAAHDERGHGVAERGERERWCRTSSTMRWVTPSSLHHAMASRIVDVVHQSSAGIVRPEATDAGGRQRARDPDVGSSPAQAINLCLKR